jgi:hypothetical protein
MLTQLALKRGEICYVSRELNCVGGLVEGRETAFLEEPSYAKFVGDLHSAHE